MLREQGVGSSNLPAPTNEINGLRFRILSGAPETAPDTQVFAAAKMGTVNVDAWRVQLLEDNRRVAIFSANAFDLALQLHAKMSGGRRVLMGDVRFQAERNCGELLLWINGAV